MSHLVTAPDMLATAAAHVDEIGFRCRAANAVRQARHVTCWPRPAVKVSAATAALFSAYGRVSGGRQAGRGVPAVHPDVGGRRQRRTPKRPMRWVSHALDTINAPIRTSVGPCALSPNGSSGAGGLPAIAQLRKSPITALIMGGTNNPLPDPEYVTGINKAFIQTPLPGCWLSRKACSRPAVLAGYRPRQSDVQPVRHRRRGAAEYRRLNNWPRQQGRCVRLLAERHDHQQLHQFADGDGFAESDDISFVMIGSGNNPSAGALQPSRSGRAVQCCPANSPYPTHLRLTASPRAAIPAAHPVGHQRLHGLLRAQHVPGTHSHPGG